jgi:hypothetical protein
MLRKSTDLMEGRDPGMTYEDAKDMIRKEGFLYEHLPRQYKTAETRSLMNDWWENHLVEKVLYYRDHPNELQELMGKKKQMEKAAEVPAQQGEQSEVVDFLRKAKENGLLDQLDELIQVMKKE